MSYTKDFLESKSHTYPEILKMTDEEALRYLDFMGELVESVDDSPTDIDEGYNLGGRVGFAGGGGDQDGPTGPGGISPGPGGPGGGMVAGASPDGQGGATFGLAPSDNLVFDGVTSLVWSWGHRNAQGLELAPNGIVYSSEHGPTNDDELNILVPKNLDLKLQIFGLQKDGHPKLDDTDPLEKTCQTWQSFPLVS